MYNCSLKFVIFYGVLGYESLRSKIVIAEVLRDNPLMNQPAEYELGGSVHTWGGNPETIGILREAAPIWDLDPWLMDIRIPLFRM